jgi:transglutaminase-like putative cysteine protease
MNRYLKRTQLLDFDQESLIHLVEERGWTVFPEVDRIAAVYNFVQNEIAFGYNEADDIPASQVLREGYGQCNTKGTLLMALLRKCSIPCRFHGFTINKRLQKGAITGVAYVLAPRDIIHSWVEVYFQSRWINLEGFILDKPYLQSIQRRFPEVEGAFRGYGIATADFRNPPVDWTGSDTYIQREGINHDFGVFDSPDEFYALHGANLTGVKRFVFKHVVRRWMNANITRIRRRALGDGPPTLGTGITPFGKFGNN